MAPGFKNDFNMRICSSRLFLVIIISCAAEYFRGGKRNDEFENIFNMFNAFVCLQRSELKTRCFGAVE